MVVVKARAYNQFGDGDYSEPNVSGATILIEPNVIVDLPVIDIVVSSTTQIKLDWNELTGDATGGSPIDSYHLQWDQGLNTDTYSDLKGQDGAFDTAVTFTITDLTPGGLYKFRLRAHNVHGWSTDYSTPVTFQAADQPA